MPSARSSSDERPRPSRADAAAARLALLAADLGAADPPGGATTRGGDQRGATHVPVTEPQEPWWGEHTRVAPARRTPPVDDSRPAGAARPAVEPAALPSPGRHAARRRRAPATGARGLPPLAPAHLTLVAVLVAVALAVTAWWVVRGRAEPVPPPEAPGTVEPLVGAVTAAQPSGAATVPTGPASAGTAPAGTVTVDVTGKVRRPGIVVLDDGSRVVDALEAAGGARPGVDLAGINLARVLTDGEQIVVGATTGPPPVGGATTHPAAPSSPAAVINLNLASPAELETLPDVGPVTAAAIVAWREQNGGFTSVDQLLDVDGIGEVTLAKLAPHVTV